MKKTILFLFIVLHMKANVGKDAPIKRYEVKTLLANLDFIKKELGDQDIIFLGDINCKSGDERAIREFLNSGFEDLNKDDTPTYIGGPPAPFDRIFVPTEDRKPFHYSRQYVLMPARSDAHDDYLSDHCIIKMMVKIRADDD